ncbi:MAG: hypothetical protein BGO33_02380 [Bacteroidia bacterium 43-41]|nr:MAG: hypothetical protein BGO33_02380 [Bacteroidia bacterium 43-41]
MMKFYYTSLFFLFSLLAFSQTKTYTTSRTQQAPEIDGQLTDDCWQNAGWESDFVQFEPNQGAAPSQQTQFAIVYDDNNLYIAIKALDSEPDKIVRRVSRRDVADGDAVAIVIDSYEDKMTAFAFLVSAAGSKTDWRQTEGNGEDNSWDPIWEVRTSLQPDGWYAEMRIPYSQLRFGKKVRYRWGLEVMRHVYRHQERSFWQPIDKASAKFIGDFGTLEGICNIYPKKDIEIVPFALSQLTLSEKETGNPFATGTRTKASMGVDGKISLTNDITLNFTINPDFGQVEADPSVVNLTNFETYFNEKRPFFVEGSNIYHYPFDLTNNEQNKLFYSRRLGREPHLNYDTKDGEYVREPGRTTILGAVKVSGKTRKGTSIGILNAVTQKMSSEIDRDGERLKYAVEPTSNYFVGRLEQDLDSGNLIVGGMITATNRKIDEQQFEVLPGSAYTAGMNLTKYWKDKSYFITARTFFSHLRGSQEAMVQLQKSSARYYQRPDAKHLELDAERTSLSGFGGSVSGGKVSGHFNVLGFSSWSSPGLEFNDIGFKPNADMFMNGVWAEWNEWRPRGIVNKYRFNGSLYNIRDFSGTSLVWGNEAYGHIQFTNYYDIAGGLNINHPGLSNSMLRGGPAIKTPGVINSWFSVESDSRKKLSMEYDMSFSHGYENSRRSISYGLDITYKPSDRLALSLYPQYVKSTGHQQYVRTVSGENPTYILSSINQNIASVSVRINYGITPDMSLQWYALPYLFSGDYYGFKTVTRPRADKFNDRFTAMDTYDYDNPDFHFLQFRSNLVYRWEYKPGSVLYLVWSQGRTVQGEDGTFRFKDYVCDLFKAAPQNDFLIKISYAWIF